MKKVAELIGDKARPVPIGPELLTNLDEGEAPRLPQAVASRDEGAVMAKCLAV